jgi:hypothetical protein
MPALADVRDQAVTGVTAPQTGEAIIRDVWQSVTAHAGAASLARTCYRSIIFAPIGWLVLGMPFLVKLLAPTRYRLTNRRLMVCKGHRAVADKEVSLDRIKDVKLVTDANSEFYVSGTLEVIDDAGQTVLSMPGVREPESVRQSILQAAAAWGPILKADKK